MRIVWSILFIASLAIVWFFLSLQVRAHDLDGQYANSPNKLWFSKQKNQKNVSCCDSADGRRLEDAEWRGDTDGNYWVLIDGEWKKVPDEAVINPGNRPISYAVVWIYQNIIYCFMPGAGT